MIESEIKNAFGINNDIDTQQLSTGLINQTYKINTGDGNSFLLQRINKRVFTDPVSVQANYLKIRKHLLEKNSFPLPGIIPANGKDLLLDYKGEIWRCFEFIPNTYSPATSSGPEEAWLVANCFGKFSAALSDLDPSSLKLILPGFHDLKIRFSQFENALGTAVDIRKKEAKRLIEYVYENKPLVDFYVKIASDAKNYHQYIMHHDCKIANILFKQDTHEIYCPIDLDTTQPGLYFSDLGDMIRSIVPNFSEDGIELDDLVLRKDFYQAVKDGYLSAIRHSFTREEMNNINIAGKLMTYMQAVRFLTDYLNNDVYYRTDYPEQNKDRAANQFKLLFLLNDYIASLREKKTYI